MKEFLVEATQVAGVVILILVGLAAFGFYVLTQMIGRP